MQAWRCVEGNEVFVRIGTPAQPHLQTGSSKKQQEDAGRRRQFQFVADPY